jgi:hypothetical protein
MPSIQARTTRRQREGENSTRAANAGARTATFENATRIGPQTRCTTHTTGKTCPPFRARRAQIATIRSAIFELRRARLTCSERDLSTARIKGKLAENDYDRAGIRLRDPGRHTWSADGAGSAKSRSTTNLFTYVNFPSCPKSKGLKEKLGSYACEKMLTLKSMPEVRK